MLPELYIPQGMTLPDNDQWQFRFNVESETSDRLYIVSQHKKKRHWACSCPAWRVHRKCKHLTALNLPNHEQPYEVRIIQNAQHG